MKHQNIHIYPGALHMHTTFSDGSGTIPEVIDAAREAGLRWIIITDHDTLAGKAFEGWHDDLLVLVGHEITPFSSHFLALNTDRVVSKDQPVQTFVDEVYALGGVGIIAHPDDHLEDKSKAIHPWKYWEIDGPTDRAGRSVGLELWNVMSDWRGKLENTNRQQLIDSPHEALTGPTTAVLNWWDQLNMAGRRTFGIGGLDAHATPSGQNTKIFPYFWMFGTLTNYLLLDAPLADDPVQANQQVLTALTQGHSYFLNRLRGTAPAIPFLAQRGDEQWHSGESPSLAGGALTLYADMGSDAEVRLIYNGQVLCNASSKLEQQIDQPGIYRVEGHKNGWAWLYTNPIYVRE